VESLASILLTLLVIALVIQFAAGGTPAVGNWLHLKFVGQGS
jgi:hypothetical protein